MIEYTLKYMQYGRKTKSQILIKHKYCHKLCGRPSFGYNYKT